MRYHPQHVQLRRLFWQKFYEEIGDVSEDVRDTIQTARMVGIFLSNGVITNFPDIGLAILESMTLKLSDIGLQSLVELPAALKFVIDSIFEHWPY
jgi:hypothetical protein